ncbi:MAG: hypothetical protein R3C14_31415 [Caldilineaceae bacterium]
MAKKQLLVNWVYYDPAGHVVEALKHAYAYYAPNQDEVDVSLLLNGDSTPALAAPCDWIRTVYPISLSEVVADGDKAACLQGIPQHWDYIVHDPRTRADAFLPGWDEPALIATQQVLRAHLQATLWQGESGCFQNRWHDQGLRGADTPLPYQANAKLPYPTPPDAQAFVQRYRHDGPKLCILPRSGAGLAQSPSMNAWTEICTALVDAIPDLRIYITGLSEAGAGERGSEVVTKQEIDQLAARLPQVVNCYDLGMWNQIALIEGCDLFCSPHTGFAFLSQLVDTPWLVVAGCPWPEYQFNGTPFYSALPNCENYPAQERTTTECGRRWVEERQVICMEDPNLRQRIPDIIAGARLLLAKTLTFDQACRLHVDKLKAAGRDPKRFLYFDWSR